MNTPARSLQAPDWLLRWEWAMVLAIAGGVLASIPWMLGHIGLSWDALNHHIYLGWTAEQNRFDRDFLAASYQSYTYPYLYWPVYKLAMAGASGTTAGMVLALIPVLAVPAIWLLAASFVPGREWYNVAMRAVATTLTFMSALVLSMFDSTANDLLAAIPLVWAYALAVGDLGPQAPGQRRWRWALAGSGILAGVAVGFKLSNAVLVLALPLLWAWPGGSLLGCLRRVVIAGLLAAAGFLAAYGYWGWMLWTHFGNPVYPLYDDWFTGLRSLTGWAR